MNNDITTCCNRCLCDYHKLIELSSDNHTKSYKTIQKRIDYLYKSDKIILVIRIVWMIFIVFLLEFPYVHVTQNSIVAH